eukprot:2288127-Rhodomonas_salina.2
MAISTAVSSSNIISKLLRFQQAWDGARDQRAPLPAVPSPAHRGMLAVFAQQLFTDERGCWSGKICEETLAQCQSSQADFGSKNNQVRQSVTWGSRLGFCEILYPSASRIESAQLPGASKPRPRCSSSSATSSTTSITEPTGVCDEALGFMFTTVGGIEGRRVGKEEAGYRWKGRGKLHEMPA